MSMPIATPARTAPTEMPAFVSTRSRARIRTRPSGPATSATVAARTLRLPAMATAPTVAATRNGGRLCTAVSAAIAAASTSRQAR